MDYIMDQSCNDYLINPSVEKLIVHLSVFYAKMAKNPPRFSLFSVIINRISLGLEHKIMMSIFDHFLTL